MLNVILDACKRSNLIKLATSQKVVSIDDDGSGVTAKTETGETYKGAALVGCDGLWSTVREHIVGDGKPVVSGHIAYRAVLPTSEWPKEYRLPKMIIWCGEKTHLVHYPLRRGELFNLVVVFHSDRYEEGWDTYGDPAELHARFADKCEPVRTLLQKVNAWKMWVLCDRPAIKDWTKGRITLLGDAAHPMLQYLAQGGNMAMEDAVCLANQIEASGRDYAAAFKKYQELRYLRTARVQLMARVFGEIYHASGVNRELRNKVLREWSRPGQHRHVVALRRAAGAAACRQRAAAAADPAGVVTRSYLTLQAIFIREENADGEARRSDRRPGDREPRAGEARHRRFVRPCQRPPSGQAGSLLSVVLAGARARQARRHHGVQSGVRADRRQGPQSLHRAPDPRRRL